MSLQSEGPTRAAVQTGSFAFKMRTQLSQYCRHIWICICVDTYCDAQIHQVVVRAAIVGCCTGQSCVSQPPIYRE